MIKTILVPTDGSAHANKAIDLAADIAKAFGARMVILHIILRSASDAEIEALWTENKMPGSLVKKFTNLRMTPVAPIAPYYEVGPLPILIPEEVLNEAGDFLLKKARQKAEAKGVKDISTNLADGAPADTIVAAAEKENADMIVMGCRGLGNIAAMVMGSVSNKVNHLSQRTCLLVK